MGDSIRLRRFSCRVLLGALLTTFAFSHSMYETAILLDFTGTEVQAELQLPLAQMTTAFGKSINAQTLYADRGALEAYIVRRFHAQSSDGRPFQTRLRAPLSVETVDDAPYLVARVLLMPPAGSRVDLFDIEDDVLLERLPSAVALVTVRSDWRTSVFANDPRLIGVLRRNSQSVTVDRTAGSWFTGFNGIFDLGLRHIREGTDHLLFLLTLLLPAPLLVSGSRWTGSVGARQSLLQILKIVTAFTLGHSLTLALATLGFVHVPSRPVEVLIAVSILVSAVHALRPLFPGREAVIAGFFGLVHGLAFATTLSELGLGRWERLASIFAFNIGIETMQLVVVAATMPSLLLLSRTAMYSVLRVCGALLAAIASLGWIAERLFRLGSSVDVIVNGVAHSAPYVAGGLFTVSLACRLRRDASKEKGAVGTLSPQPVERV